MSSTEVHAERSTPRVLALNCFVHGNNPKRIFPVAMDPNDTVGELRKAIKTQRNAFQTIDADALELWAVSIPADSVIQRINKCDFKEEESLLPTKKLSRVFPSDLEKDHVHVVIQPPKVHERPTPPAEFQLVHQLLKSDDLIKICKDYLNGFPKMRPSSMAAPSQLRSLQARNKLVFLCNRPPNAAPTIPLTLRHPIFNQFRDDCNNHQPTLKDNMLAFEIAHAMSDFYEKELDRQTKFIKIFGGHGIHVSATAVPGTKFLTDSDMQNRGHPYLICEFKNEIGSGEREPTFQIAEYYAHFLNNQDSLSETSLYPCIGLYVVGSLLDFVGLGYAEGVIIQVLEQPIRLDYHLTDVKLRLTTARYLGVLKNVIGKLREYYDAEVFPPGPLPHMPCYFEYTSLTRGVRLLISYESQVAEKLVFYGLVDGNHRVCVKFVTSYSRKAHEICANNQFAPVLEGFEALPGGWFMVIMDSVDESFQPLCTVPPDLRNVGLYDIAKKKLTDLHQAGYVHGDVRDANLMVAKDGSDKCMLIDFDWAGKAESTRYPMNIYSGPDLWRPKEVFDGEIIRAEHDIAMLDAMFPSS